MEEEFVCACDIIQSWRVTTQAAVEWFLHNLKVYDPTGSKGPIQ